MLYVHLDKTVRRKEARWSSSRLQSGCKEEDQTCHLHVGTLDVWDAWHDLRQQPRLRRQQMGDEEAVHIRLSLREFLFGWCGLSWCLRRLGSLFVLTRTRAKSGWFHNLWCHSSARLGYVVAKASDVARAREMLVRHGLRRKLIHDPNF